MSKDKRSLFIFRYLQISIFSLLYVFISCAYSDQSTVSVYPSPDESFKSSVYRVTIKQGDKSLDSFVYADENKFIDHKDKMTDWNHWTTFSFSGKVTVIVELLSGDIKNCTVYPLAKAIKPLEDNSTLKFQLKSPAKLYIEIPGHKEHPLFIFADAPEQNIPDKNSANIVWFSPGIHDISKHYKLESNTTYYLQGGAYLKGSMRGVGVSNVKICGRGILSGENLPHMSYKSNRFEGVSIQFDNGGINQSVEGITIINPSMYCIQSYSGFLTTRNVKCFGWYYETDGWVGGDGSVLEDSFFKVNDDVVKLYKDNLTIRDLVIYHQFNGAVFQFGWGGESAANGTIENIDIVNCEVKYSPTFKSNRALINRRKGNVDTITHDFRFSNIRIDQDISQVIGLSTDGVIKDITLENFALNGKQRFDSYLKGGVISGLTLENITLANKKRKTPVDINMQTMGDISKISINP